MLCIVWCVVTACDSREYSVLCAWERGPNSCGDKLEQRNSVFVCILPCTLSETSPCPPSIATGQ